MPRSKTEPTNTVDVGATYRQPTDPNVRVVSPAEAAPSGAEPFDPGFVPEGTQQELDRTGEATNPFTGKRITG